MRTGAAVSIAVLFAAAAAASGHPVGTRAPDGSLAVGYASAGALVRAARASHGTIVRTFPALRVAEVRGANSRTLGRASGIRFVQLAATRESAGGPVGYAVDNSPEWQFRATHTDAVPDSILRAASAVTIGVIDTGADVGAPDLAAKTPVTWNTRTGTTDVRDTNGHGTFVASVAAGSVTNDDGISGAGGDAQLIIVKSGSDGGSFTDLDEAAGITYAIDHGARILNLSVGGPSTSVTERRAIQYAVAHGALVIAAVGNEYAQKNPVEYPAALLQPLGSDGTGGAGLAVTASTPDGKRAVFANTGSWVSLAAPGERVFGALSSASSPLVYPRTSLAGAKSGLYGYASGTSFAAPQVAGAAALVWAANPSLTAQQVAQILKETASGGGKWTAELGFGVIDVAAAVARAQQGRTGVLLSGLRDKSGVRLRWSGDGLAYTLLETTDGHASRTLLSSTQRTSLSLPLMKGHTYSFTVKAIDAGGTPTATSAPVTFAVKR